MTNNIDKKLFEKLPLYAKKWKWLYLEKVNEHQIDGLCQVSEDDTSKLIFVCDSWTEFLWFVRRYHSKKIKQFDS
jgi:hypothetical protein